MKQVPRHNGRASRVREWLQNQSKPRRPAEIHAAVDPTGTLAHMCATLTALVAGGFVNRIGHGKGGGRFQIASETPQKSKGGWQCNRRKATAPSAPNLAPGRRPVSQNPTRIVQAGSAPPRVQSTNFSAPIAMVSDPNNLKRQQSAQIAADIKAFGVSRIERLPDGASGQPLKHQHHRKPE